MNCIKGCRLVVPRKRTTAFADNRQKYTIDRRFILRHRPNLMEIEKLIHTRLTKTASARSG
jgi:hypothetical protein